MLEVGGFWQPFIYSDPHGMMECWNKGDLGAVRELSKVVISSVARNLTITRFLPAPVAQAHSRCAVLSRYCL
jgi:hypothetical protein